MPPKRACSQKGRTSSNELSAAQQKPQRQGPKEWGQLRSGNTSGRRRWDNEKDEGQGGRSGETGRRERTSQGWRPRAKPQSPENTSLTKSYKTNLMNQDAHVIMEKMICVEGRGRAGDSKENRGTEQKRRSRALREANFPEEGFGSLIQQSTLHPRKEKMGRVMNAET